MKKLLFALLCACLLPAPAPAAQIIEREMRCPVCGHQFYAKLDAPDADYEMRLDLKPLGAIPGPWRLPDCEKCGFVIYSSRVSKEELAKAMAAAASPDYRASAVRSTYYKTGVIFRLLGKPDFLVANTYLKASWQEESDPARLKEDLELSLKHFTACAAACTGAEKENSQLLIGELLRRLGRFGEAKAHFAGLRSEKGFQDNFFADIVAFQLQLCDKKDDRAHDMVEVKVAKLPLAARLRWRAKKFYLELRESLR